MSVTFAGLCHLSAVVCGSSRAETANVSISTTVFAISFSQSTGSFPFPITGNADCFAVFLYQAAAELLDRFREPLTQRSLAIGDSDDICLFHVSDGGTNVTAEHDARHERNVLCWKYDSYPGRCATDSDGVGGLSHRDGGNRRRMMNSRPSDAECRVIDRRDTGTGDGWVD